MTAVSENLPAALRRADRIVPAIAVLIAGVFYALAHHRSPLRPTALRPGWFSWFDAAKYLHAAIAWAHLDLHPASHWYPPGYPMMGAIGYAFTPTQPFYIPDGLSLMAACWLFSLIAAEILHRPGARALGALVFLVTTIFNPDALFVWIAPWSTTPATPAIYGCLLAGLRFLRHPRAPTACLAGLAGAGVLLFRPTESALVLFTTGLSMLWTMLRQRLAPRRVAVIVAAGLAGVAAPIALFIAAESATGGFGPDGYIALSQHYGFEFSLVWPHWVEIVGDPQPLWPGEHGLVRAFPWIVPGAVSIILLLWCAPRAAKAGHLLLAGTAVLHSLLFLAYRDMEPIQVWWIFLYHYFKWVLPVAGLYAAMLPAFLIGRRWRFTVPAAAVVAIALFGWRPELRPVPGATAIRIDQHHVRLPLGLGSMRDALAVPATADFDGVFHFEHKLTVAGHTFQTPFSLRAFPRPGGLLLLPLRPLPAGDTVVTFNDAVTIDTGSQPFLARQTVVFGMPCWLRPSRSVCHPPPLFPGPILATGQTVRFDRSNPFEVEGWARPETAGTWTTGREALLDFRVRPVGQGAVLAFTARFYVPRGRPPSPVDIKLNGNKLLRLSAPNAGIFSIDLPTASLGPDGQVLLDFLIENPTSPSSNGEGADTRKLGLQIQSMRLLPARSPA